MTSAEHARRVRRGRGGLRQLVGANPGYHEHLRISARRMRIPGRGQGLRLLDAGCGTGASTAALLAVAPEAEIVAVDASRGHARRGAAKRWPASVRFVHSRVEDLAEAGVDGPFDGILAAYLIRNLADPDGQLRGSGRCCARAARWPCTNTRCATRRGHRVWNAVCWGDHHPGRPAAHRRRRPVPISAAKCQRLRRRYRFRDRLRDNGFTAVHSETMPGWQRNIVHTFLADAPR